MDKNEQIKFVKALVGSVLDTVATNIERDLIPDTWDGFELRQYLADKFADASYVDMSRKRKAEYQNTIMINNL